MVELEKLTNLDVCVLLERVQMREEKLNTMAIELVPLPLPASADASKFKDFGREVRGVNPGSLTSEQFEQVKDALYKVSWKLFRIR